MVTTRRFVEQTTNNNWGDIISPRNFVSARLGNVKTRFYHEEILI